MLDANEAMSRILVGNVCSTCIYAAFPDASTEIRTLAANRPLPIYGECVYFEIGREIHALHVCSKYNKIPLHQYIVSHRFDKGVVERAYADQRQRCLQEIMNGTITESETTQEAADFEGQG